MTKDWTKHQRTILGLYKGQGKTLKEVRDIMQRDHGFIASTRAYRSRFDKWDIRKYNKSRRRFSTMTAPESNSQAKVMAYGRNDGHHVPGCDGRRHTEPNLAVQIIEHQYQYFPRTDYHVKSEPYADNSDISPSMSTPFCVQDGLCRGWGPLHVLTSAFAHDSLSPQDHNAMLPSPLSIGPSDLPTKPDTQELVFALRTPVRRSQLELLWQHLDCLPNICSPVPSGTECFSHLAALFFECLPGGADESLWVACLEKMLQSGVGTDAHAVLFHFLQDPVSTRAFGVSWGVVRTLAGTVQLIDGRDMNILQALLRTEHAITLPTNEAFKRAELIEILIPRLYHEDRPDEC